MRAHHPVQRRRDDPEGARGQDLPRREHRVAHDSVGPGAERERGRRRRLPPGVGARPLPGRRPRRSPSATRTPRTARSTTSSTCSRRATGRSRRTRCSTARRTGAACSSTRSRSRSCWPGRSGERMPRPTPTHVKTAADFLVGHGPSTPQERWEEEGGYSPSTIAAEIAGLTAAASIAATNGDEASAAIYTGVADDWQRKVQGWTFTTTGPLGDGQYYERIDDNGEPERRPHARHQQRRRRLGRALDRRRRLPRPGAPRRQAGRRRRDHRLAARGRRDDQGRHAERCALVPLQPRRLRREGQRGALRRHRRRPTLAAPVG